MVFNEQWNVRSRSRECAVTGERFSEGQSIMTALFPDQETGGFLRKDFTEEAWKMFEKETGLKPFSSWRTTFVPTPVLKKDPPVTKHTAEQLLTTLVEQDEEHTENTRYILAVMLERQKLLRETDQQATPSGILRIYEHRKTGEVFIVKDPNIPLADVEEIQNEVIELLSPAPDPESEAETEESAPS